MTNNRIVFLVEGDTEIWFVNHCIIPFLYSIPEAIEHEWTMSAQKVTTNRKKNAKGGVVSYHLVKNEINRVRSQGSPWITTLFDFFQLPSSFPCFKGGYESIHGGFFEDIQYERLLPYIQKYEFEAFLFCVPEAFERLDIDAKQLAQIVSISKKYKVVEDINGGLETAPSKRLKGIFHYEKEQDSRVVLMGIPMEIIMERSPHFKEWIENLVRIVRGEEPVVRY